MMDAQHENADVAQAVLGGRSWSEAPAPPGIIPLRTALGSVDSFPRPGLRSEKDVRRGERKPHGEASGSSSGRNGEH